MTTTATATKPKRIQRKRTKGWAMPPNTVYVGRPTKWGNPYVIGSEAGFVPRDGGPVFHITAANCLRLFREHAIASIALNPTWLEPLRGKDLACFCKEGEPCHADILLELANQD